MRWRGKHTVAEQGAYTQTMLMARHHKIAKLFDEDFMVRNDEVGKGAATKSAAVSFSL